MNSLRKILALIMLISANLCFSQDMITMKGGEDIVAKVLEITLTEVKYKKFDFQDGPTYTILKSNTLMIRYHNGSKDIFPESVSKPKEDSISEVVPYKRMTYDGNGLPTLRSQDLSPLHTEDYGDLFIKGQSDASIHYKGYKAAGTGTLVVSLLSPIVGLIPAIGCSATQPKDINLDYPDSDLMKKPAYYNGYTQKSKKIKQGKVWANWAIAFGVNVVAVIVIYGQ